MLVAALLVAALLVAALLGADTFQLAPLLMAGYAQPMPDLLAREQLLPARWTATEVDVVLAQTAWCLREIGEPDAIVPSHIEWRGEADGGEGEVAVGQVVRTPEVKDVNGRRVGENGGDEVRGVDEQSGQ